MAAERFYLPFRPTFDMNGVALPEARLYFYVSGGTTPAPAYSDVALTIALPHPVIADAAGRWPAIYLDDTITYRVVIKDSTDTVIPGHDDDPYVASITDDLTPELEELLTDTITEADRAEEQADIATEQATLAEGFATEAGNLLSGANSRSTPTFPIFADDPLYGLSVDVDEDGRVVFGLSDSGTVYGMIPETFPIFADDPLYGSSVIVNEDGEVLSGVSVSRPAADKIIVLLGDSITANYNIPGLVASLSSATVHNFAWGGSRVSSGGSAFANAYSVAAIAGAVASGTWTAIIAGVDADYPTSSSTDIAARARVREMAAFDWTTPDAILILGGTNDWSAQITIGSATSTTTTEFNGAVNEIVRQLQEEAPSAQISLATPTWRGPLATLGDSNVNPNGAGVYLSAFCDAIRNNRWQVPVLDLAKTLGINTANKTLMLADDLHPTPTGAARWAQRITIFINSLF
jgi:lysophospholipase L1-like esterase